MYCVIDIETLAIEPSEKEVARAREKLSRRFKGALDKKVDEWKEKFKFRPNGALPICVGMGLIECTNSGLELTKITGYQAPKPDESGVRAVCEIVQSTLDAWDVHKVVGFNCDNFDLPILVLNMSRRGIYPKRSWGRYDVVDLMKRPWNGVRFDMKSLAGCFGFEEAEGEEVDGSMVADMYAFDQKEGTNTVLKYCLSDIEKTARIFLELSKFYQL